MLRLQETKPIEGQYGVTLSFELEEPDIPMIIDNETNAEVGFVLVANLGGQ